MFYRMPGNPNVPRYYGLRALGLLDALARPELVRVSDASQPISSIRPNGPTGTPPPRRRTKKVGLLDALGDVDTSTQRRAFGSPRELRSTTSRVHFPPSTKRSTVQQESDSGILDSIEDDLVYVADGIANALSQRGKDFLTGVRLGSSGMYETAGDLAGLINRTGDIISQSTGLIPMSEGTVRQDIEDWLYSTAGRVAPPPEDIPTDFYGKVYTGLGQAPGEAAQYLLGARLLRPTLGLASLYAIREADKGWEAAANAGVRGALLGKTAELIPALPSVGRAGVLGSVGAADTVAQGGDAADVLTTAATMAALGAFGSKPPRPMTYSQQQLHDLQRLFNEFRREEIAHLAKTGVLKRVAPKIYRKRGIVFNKRIGGVTERLGRETDVVGGYSIDRAPRYYIFDRGKREWRQGDWVRTDANGKPIEIMDAKYGETPANQLRKDKSVPLPTTYLHRDEIVRITKKLLKKKK